jgi:hypothetical protein
LFLTALPPFFKTQFPPWFPHHPLFFFILAPSGRAAAARGFFVCAGIGRDLFFGQAVQEFDKKNGSFAH